MTADLLTLTDPVVAWITGPLVRAMLVLAACLALVAVAQWMLRRLARQLRDRPRPEGGLSRGDRTAVVVIVGLAALFVGIAFTMSAAALHDSATWLEDTPVPINGGDLRFMFPLVLDGLIVMFLALDLWTEWRQMRHPFYRWVAYGLSTLTLYLNIRHGGGGSWLGHAAPPLGVIVISEGLAIWIRSMARMIDTGQGADRVPLGHWVARPASAWRVWRLMLGWHITSYEEAVGMERRRSMAYAMLREQYGPGWRRATPRHLRWMLDNGSELAVAYDIIRAMTRDRVAMSPEEVDGLAAARATPAPAPRVDVVEVDDAPGDTAGDDRDTGGKRRSLLERMTVVAVGRSDIAAGDTPALEQGEATGDTGATGDTVQVGADVAPGRGDVSLPEATGPDATGDAGEVSRDGDVDGPAGVVSLSDMADRDRQVVSWLIATPDMSGAEIGRRVGATAKTGQRLKKRLGPVADRLRDAGQATPDDAGDASPEERPAVGDELRLPALPAGVRVKHWK